MAADSQNQYTVVIREEFIPNNIRVDIYTRTWEPADVKPKACIVFIHGQGEHVCRYDHVFNEFAKAGLKVHGFDQVGCGKTGQKVNDLGGALGLKRVLCDVNDAIDRMYDPDIPLFLMGHSFGGACTLNYLAIGDRRDILHGSLVSAPCIRVAKKSIPMMPIQSLLNHMSPLFPIVKVPADLDTTWISREKSEVKKYNEDPLIFSRCSLVQVRDVLFEGQCLLEGRYKQINIPRLHICHGSGDNIADYSATLELSDRLKVQKKVEDLQFKEYPGAYHELHNDTCKEEVIASHLNWFLTHI